MVGGADNIADMDRAGKMPSPIDQEYGVDMVGKFSPQQAQPIPHLGVLRQDKLIVIDPVPGQLIGVFLRPFIILALLGIHCL